MSTLPSWREALQRSIAQNRHDRASSWFQLATVRNDGRPAVRTVVFRGFRGNDICIVTDRRSGKIKDLLGESLSQVGAGQKGSYYVDTVPAATCKPNRYGEIAWYFGTTREQWRIAGRLSLVADDALLAPSSSPETTSSSSSSSIDIKPDISVSNIHHPMFLELQEERAKLWTSMSDAARASFAWPEPASRRVGGNEEEEEEANGKNKETSSADGTSYGGNSSSSSSQDTSALLAALPAGNIWELMKKEYQRELDKAGNRTIIDNNTNCRSEEQQQQQNSDASISDDPKRKGLLDITATTDVNSTAILGAISTDSTGKSHAGVSDTSLLLYGYPTPLALEEAIVAAYKNFVLVLLSPSELDHLSLKPPPSSSKYTQTRWKYFADEKQATFVYP